MSSQKSTGALRASTSRVKSAVNTTNIESRKDPPDRANRDVATRAEILDTPRAKRTRPETEPHPLARIGGAPGRATHARSPSPKKFRRSIDDPNRRSQSPTPA
ncbi:hypothetical protein JAAARDRAFT_37189 [Jaapia argillacea MUCL 33604]|uniref:Uncharacterized protein n=1 Tax=Jaapia argillacea MUCL 33604 TaxID=933084 RepID=A0A067PPN5_9AGAM|nr:hypothetical protein JAAARDRAFT_37189 [Jaapia argillacea MUCL 33604]